MTTLSSRHSDSPSGRMPVKSTEMARSTESERFGVSVDLSSAAAIA